MRLLARPLSYTLFGLIGLVVVTLLGLEIYLLSLAILTSLGLGVLVAGLLGSGGLLAILYYAYRRYGHISVEDEIDQDQAWPWSIYSLSPQADDPAKPNERASKNRADTVE
jgi:hypothetical protein